MSFKKVERDGKVAVLISGGFGAGWSTKYCDNPERICMDEDIVLAVLDKDIPRAVKIAKGIEEDFYDGGADGLRVEWVQKGDRFEIIEYDGRESLRIFDKYEGFVA